MTDKTDDPAPDRSFRTARTRGPSCPVTEQQLHGLYDLMTPVLPARGKDMRVLYSDPLVANTGAFRNGRLQGAHPMIAARALGLDCGPMSGFRNRAVDFKSSPNARVKANFICSTGCGPTAHPFPCNPRVTSEGAGRFP